MKQILKKIIILILTFEAKIMLRIKQPAIIAVVGSVGKTSTKDAIYSALAPHLSVRKNKKSLNSEFGVPLTILNLDSGWSDIVAWAKNIIAGFVSLFSLQSYPAYLVLEVGTDVPGDMAAIASWLRPDIVVITTLPELPVHVAHFDSPEDLRNEDASIISYVKQDGVVILNTDDSYVRALQPNITQRVITYGTLAEYNPDIFMQAYEVLYENKNPVGISVDVSGIGDAVATITLPFVVGQQHVYSLLAGFAVGVAVQLTSDQIAEGLFTHDTPSGRMKILHGIYDSVLIDDSYNASPIAVQKALETLSNLESFEGRNKVAVLGDMLELGDFSKAAHIEVGKYIAASNITHVITYGDDAQLIATAALENGMDQSQVMQVATHQGASDAVHKIVQSNDIVLVKGSQGSRMEKVLTLLLKDAKDAVHLVRQESVWSGM